MLSEIVEMMVTMGKHDKQGYDSATIVLDELLKLFPPMYHEYIIGGIQELVEYWESEHMQTKKC